MKYIAILIALFPFVAWAREDVDGLPVCRYAVSAISGQTQLPWMFSINTARPARDRGATFLSELLGNSSGVGSPERVSNMIQVLDSSSPVYVQVFDSDEALRYWIEVQRSNYTESDSFKRQCLRTRRIVGHIGCASVALAVSAYNAMEMFRGGEAAAITAFFSIMTFSIPSVHFGAVEYFDTHPYVGRNVSRIFWPTPEQKTFKEIDRFSRGKLPTGIFHQYADSEKAGLSADLVIRRDEFGKLSGMYVVWPTVPVRASFPAPQPKLQQRLLFQP